MRIPGKRVHRIRLVRTPGLVAAAEVEAVFPDEDPCEACFESDTVGLLRDVQKHAERADLRWLQRRGNVYRAIEVASKSFWPPIRRMQADIVCPLRTHRLLCRDHSL